METIAGYIRVSGQKLNTDGLRLQDVNRQREKITKFCEAMNWNAPIFFCDDGISAYKEDYNSRPDFCRMLREIRANRIQRVIVEDLTRWSRRIEDGLKTMREASEKATITSMAEGEVDITLPDGWFKTAVAFLLAEWSSKSSSYKVQSGMQRRLNNEEKKCPFCNEVHLGRHPDTCGCDKCLKRKGREKRSESYYRNKPTKNNTVKRQP
jgi:DNA invertase Pin-like site-specific DNA recombinase